MKNRKIFDRMSEKVAGDQIINSFGDEEKHLIDMLKEAVDLVYKEERMLFSFLGNEQKGLEQAFVFRTGVYLKDILNNSNYSNLDLDSEYNKELGLKKATKRFPKGIRPDLLLHERNTHGNNIMAVEFKGWWKNKRQRDIEKLEDLTSIKGPYKYFIGVFILLEKEGPNFLFFKNGEEVQYE